MKSVRLFDEQPTAAQQAVAVFWLLNVSAVAMLWATTAHYGDLAGWLDAIGMLLGLFATFCALTQFMLMGRIGWIERSFGLDRLAGFHRINGYVAITFILLHPLFITASYAIQSHVGPIHQYIDLITHYKFVWLALIGELLFIAVVTSSIYVVRKRLKFETWYAVHVMVYAAIISSSLHQFYVSDSFAGTAHPLARAYWLGLYGFVALNLLIWRFGQPIYSALRFGFVVDKIVTETSTTTSVYIRGNKLTRWRSKPGQFVLVRFLNKKFWWQEHPFSLSWIPHDDLIRLTIRHVGDFTNEVAGLKPGTRVMLSGPFGRFTGAIAQTDKRLFVAGGVGITPIRSMIEEAIRNKLDVVLLYANRTPDDVVFANELSQLSDSDKNFKIINIFSDPPKGYQGQIGYIDTPSLIRNVPDFAGRDVYICGPPPMMVPLLAGLAATDIDNSQVHFERFALRGE